MFTRCWVEDHPLVFAWAYWVLQVVRSPEIATSVIQAKELKIHTLLITLEAVVVL